MTYPQAIRYLETFINYERAPEYPYGESLRLERVRNFLLGLSSPQDSFKCIHVAGSKGKGSTCAFIAYILKEAGFKVGLYTSPHLSDFRERIRILVRQRSSAPACRSKEEFEGMISKRSLAGLVTRLKPAIDKYNRVSKYGPLSFFEVYTALAFVYFKERDVDFAVLETGLGGRLDATNTVKPLVCAITPISYEHTHILGNTLKEIAAEKAGIIKSYQRSSAPALKLTVISAPQEREARRVIQARCRQVGAEFYEVGKDIKFQKRSGRFKVLTPLGEYNNLGTKLLGVHQVINATVAVGVADALRRYNKQIQPVSVRKGLCATVWPGRCEIAGRNPLVVLDGAQNAASAGVLKKAVRDNFKYKKLILVLGISADKDIKGICRQLRGLADKVILTRSNSPRAAAFESMAGYLKGADLYLSRSVKEAKKIAESLANKEDLILVCGSLFVVGDFKDASK
jgi:dihydrofolate synthase / folylpolyglutamate synthase